MAIVYEEDFSAGDSLFVSMYHYDRPDDGTDPLYPFMRSQEGGYINGDGHYDHDPAYTGEFETYQQCGFWVKGAGAFNGGGPGGYSGPGFWDGTVGYIEALYHPTTLSLSEISEEFVTAPMIQLTDPFAVFPFVGIDAQLDDDFLIVRHQNSGSHANEVELLGAPLPVAGEPYLVRIDWQCGTWDDDISDALEDGYVRVYINGELIYEAVDISLYFAPLTVPVNRVDSAIFGYFGLLGPLEYFTINDEAYPLTTSHTFRSGGTEYPLVFDVIAFKEGV